MSCVEQYFGPEYARKPWETQVDTPVGELCALCDEAIERGDIGTVMSIINMGPDGKPVAARRPVHHECSMRSVIGSVAHIEGTCSCNIPGSSEGDDPNLTKRQAAIAAVRAWEARRGQ